MQDQLNVLKGRLATVGDLRGAGAVLSWDQETCMPSGGARPRADQRGTLAALAHEMFTADEVGRLLDDLAPLLDELPAGSPDACLIRVTRREYERERRLPTALVRELMRVRSLAGQAWREARASSSFAHFTPLLRQMVDLQIEKAGCFAPYDNPYDPLLDSFEPGLDSAQIGAVFGGLKPPLVELVQAISGRLDAVDGAALHRPVPVERQMAFAQEVVRRLGFDLTRGRIDLSTHPFTSASSRDDVRLTTRFDPGYPHTGLMSAIHEAGHGIHRQNTAPEIQRTPLVSTPSQAVAESQSRFYELLIGQARPFWRFLYPQMQAAFAPAFDDLALETFYQALNRVEPSLIRVEADEVTYGLHIILRFELENDLINGRVKVDDLPAEWNARMEAYLGVVPPNDAKGVLQDIHWSMGLFGYFPDYQLGTMFAVQLWQALLAAHPGVESEIERGELGTALGWLRENIMQHGASFTLPELAERAAGGPLRWEPFMDYLRAKYGEIYGL